MLHLGGAVSTLLSVGLGFTTAGTLCTFEHPLAVNVITYVTVIGLTVLLTSVSVMLPDAPLDVFGVIPATAARVQENIVFAVELVAVKFVETLLHLGGIGKLLITGVGFTLAVTFATFEQPFAVNVILYMTSIGFDVLFTNVSVIPAPVPLPLAGVIPATAARVQLNVVPPILLVAV